LHGGGVGGEDYSLENPTPDQGWERREYAPIAAPGMARQGAGGELPKGFNPTSLTSQACNANPRGCQPYHYAQWLAGQVGGQSNLNKVTMVPPGHVSVVNSFDNPVAAEALGPFWPFPDHYAQPGTTPGINHMTGAHEYRAVPGRNNQAPGSWVDVGLGYDHRTSKVPLLGGVDEAGEITQHLALPPALGGGNFGSYLDKVQAINNNPDATYGQKVDANLARPLGAAVALGQSTAGLAGDVGHLARQQAQMFPLEARGYQQNMRAKYEARMEALRQRREKGGAYAFGVKTAEGLTTLSMEVPRYDRMSPQSQAQAVLSALGSLIRSKAHVPDHGRKKHHANK
jgi:hypothetical protein